MIRHHALNTPRFASTARTIALIAGMAIFFQIPLREGRAQTGDTASSLASPAASDGSSVPADANSPHGWLLAPAVGRLPVAIMHLPPRDGNLNVEGTLKLASVLTEQPLALVSDNARVLIVLAASRGSESNVRLRRVVSMSAARTQTGIWEYRPLGRTSVEPELPGTGRLIDTCASSGGPLVLLGPTAAEASPGINAEVLPTVAAGAPDAPWRLLQLIEGKWQEITLPESLANAAPSAAVRLSTGPTGRTTLWMQPAESPAAIIWTVPVDPLNRPEDPATAPVPAAGLGKSMLFTVDGVTLAATVTANEVELSTSAGGVWRRLTTIGRGSSPASTVSIVGLSGISRIAIVTAEAIDPTASVKPAPATSPKSSTDSNAKASDPETPATPQPPRSDGAPIVNSSRNETRSLSLAANRTFSFIEVSAIDGRTLFTGPAKREGVVTSRDFHILTLAFSSLMVAVLLFVLRTDRKPVLLPPGSSLASGPRRAAATLVDAAAITLLSGPLLGVNLSELFSAQIILSPGSVLGSIVAIMVLGAVHGTVSETLWGRTIGKFVTNCDVVGFRLIKPDAKAPAATDAHASEQNAAPQKHDNAAESAPDAIVQSPSGPVFRIGNYEIGQPLLWQAATRNAVKWLLWPLTLVALFDPSGRHPGDVIASTVVVEWPAEVESDGED